MTLLGVAVACGHSGRHPAEGTPLGSAGAGGDPGDTSAEPLGGAAGATVATVGGAPVDGAAGDRDEAAAGAPSHALGGAGGSGAPAVVDGGAGAGGANECADVPEVELQAPLVTTSLTTVAPFEVTLGQGFQGDLLEAGQGQVLSAGCVTGQETNDSLAVGAGGTEVLSAGTPKLGAMQAKLPAIASFLTAPTVAPYKTLLAEDASRSTWGYASTSIRLWSYFLVQEKRSQVASCGNGFVRFAMPTRTLAVALKLTFPSTEERDLFDRCFTAGDADITKLPDPEPLSRYLVQHEAQLALHVLSAAGPIPAVQQLLDDTQCSIVNLPACAATLDALEELRSALLETPEDTVPLADIVPAWGIFDFKVGDYSLLPD